MGFEKVKTHLNSGNVLFETNIEDPTSSIEEMIQTKFGLDIPVFVTNIETVEEALEHAPNWWGNEDKNIYDNLIHL